MPFLPGKMPKPAVCRRPATSFHADLCRWLPLSALEAQCHPQPAPAPSAGFPCPGRHRYGLARPALPREPPVDGYVLQNCTYSPSLVALPLPVARLAGYTAPDMVEGRQQPEPPAPLAMDRRSAWAAASGPRISSPCSRSTRRSFCSYDLPITGLSPLIAVAASYLAMYMTARPRFGLLPRLLAACCIGLGIAAMHYTGMAAMRSVAT